MSMQSVLSYKNDRVVERFLKLYEIEKKHAEQLFVETLKFLWACSVCRHVLGPVTIIDEMWHNFILFTGDYAKFCNDYLGRYIHHNPAEDESRSELVRSAALDGYDSPLERQLDSLCDIVGEQTVFLWYVRYPQIYDQKFYDTKQRPPTARIPERSVHLEYFPGD